MFFFVYRRYFILFYNMYYYVRLFPFDNIHLCFLFAYSAVISDEEIMSHLLEIIGNDFENTSACLNESQVSKLHVYTRAVICSIIRRLDGFFILLITIR